MSGESHPGEPPITRVEDSGSNGATRYDGGGGGLAGSTRFDGAAVADGPITRLDGPLPGAQFRLNLPPELRDEFEIVEELRGGGEADVVVVRRLSDDERVVLKLYRGARRPDPAVLERVSALPVEHVVRLLRWGNSDWGAWEMLEYVQAGSLDRLLREEGPELSQSRVREIIGELVAAFDALHASSDADGREMLHGDVKPSNIFVRSYQPLDLVLADWGLARVIEDSRVESSFGAGSAPYQAPESFAGEHSPEGDWWALGMIVAEAAMGQHPFSDASGTRLSDKKIEIAVSKRPVPLDGIDDSRLLLLCRGLLLRDPDLRWGGREVHAWLDGQSPVVAEDRLPATRTAAVEPFIFAGERCEAPEVLAALFAQHWDEAMQLLSGSASEAPDYERFETWLREHEHRSALRLLEQSAQDRSFARRLFRLIHTLDPEFPPSFRGHLIDRDGLLRLARAAAAGNEEAQTTVYDLLGLGILAETARREGFIELDAIEDRWRENMELLPRLRQQLRDAAPALGQDLGEPLDDEAVVRAIRGRVLASLLDPGEGEQLEAEVGDATQPALASHAEYRDHFQALRGDGREPVRLIAALLALRPARERYDQEVEERRVTEAAEARRRQEEEEEAQEQRDRNARRTDGWLVVIFGALVVTYAPSGGLGALLSKSGPFRDSGPLLLNALGDKQPVLNLSNWATGSAVLLAGGAVVLLCRRMFSGVSRFSLPSAVIAAGSAAALFVLLPTIRNANWQRALNKIGPLRTPTYCTASEGAAYHLKTGIREPIFVGRALSCETVTRLAHRRGQVVWRRWIHQIHISRLHKFNDGSLVVGGTWGIDVATRVVAIGLDPHTGQLRWRSSCSAEGPHGADGILFGSTAKGAAYVRLRCASNEVIRIQPKSGERTVLHIARKLKPASSGSSRASKSSTLSSLTTGGRRTPHTSSVPTRTSRTRTQETPSPQGGANVSGGVGGTSGSSGVSGGVGSSGSKGGVTGGVGG